MDLNWDDPMLAVASDDRRTFKYRLLQSWYRQTVLNAGPGSYTPRGGSERPLGSLLNAADLNARPALNFLNDSAYAHALDRIEKVRTAGGSLDPNRLKANMLSSMPVCFNLFGALRDDPAFRDLVRATLDPEAVRIVRVDCEWAPPPADALSDKTAFDAVVVTERAGGKNHIIGIETKYTEPFSAKRYPAAKYQMVHDGSDWFQPGTADILSKAATNQLWRNAMLASACVTSGHASTAAVAVVAVEGDTKAGAALSGVRAAMHTPELHCIGVSFEQFVSAATEIGGACGEWALAFERRYLDLSPVVGVESELFSALHHRGAR